jgi:nucleoid-associated protein EbfC
MMKQAQKLQEKMIKLQEELAEKTVESSAGGGMVKVVANGKTADRLYSDRKGSGRP